MFKAIRQLPIVLATTVLLAAPACATGGAYSQRYPVADRNDRAYYDRGFREGLDAGADDARRGRSYDVRRHGEYRDNSRGNDRGDLVAFRQGFESGYGDGYRSYARGGYGAPRPPYPPASTYPQYPGSSRDQDRYGDRYPYYGGTVGRLSSPAADNGYRDGFDEGQKAARSGDRYDPIGEKRYREGDHDYNSRYGSRQDYERNYRAAFQQGYDAGYRGYRR
jgi:hypothetical protein